MAGQGSGIGRGALEGIGGQAAGPRTLDNYAALEGRYTRPNIRDEVVLRTVCGCEKIVSMPPPYHRCDVRFRIKDTYPYVNTHNGDVTNHIRRFASQGDRDSLGRPVLMEQFSSINWEQKYHELHEQVYGMDRGL